MKVLINHKQDINLRCDNKGNTPLHYTIFGNALDCMKYLLEIGVRTDILNGEGLAAVDIAKVQCPDLVPLFHGYDSCKILILVMKIM